MRSVAFDNAPRLAPGVTQPPEARNLPMLPSLIVGIGGSAGAASALRKVLSHLGELPLGRMAVIIQLHQNLTTYQQPGWLLGDVTSALGELTVGVSEPPKVHVEEVPMVHAPIRSGVVYVCEPGYVTSITQIGDIKRVRSETANSTSITTLLSELSILQHYALVVQSVGVVLSGMAGNDGIEGARELHSAGGQIIVQDPKSCEFSEMPAGIISAVPESIVGLPEDICNLIGQHALPKPSTSNALDLSSAEQTALMRDICDTVIRERGCDFRLYHSNMVIRRVMHCERAQMHTLHSLSFPSAYLLTRTSVSLFLFLENRHALVARDLLRGVRLATTHRAGARRDASQ